jgi:membrane fusion protein, heavy metal efflux system
MNVLRVCLYRRGRRQRALAPHRPAESFLLPALLLAAAALSLAGCGSGPGEGAGAMTSFSTGQGNGSQAELFSVPANQMGRLQIITVAPGKISRVLRLAGSVAYNAFETTPVIAQVGGPVTRIVVAPGDHVRVGQPMLYVNSPDYSTQSAAYLKARDAFQLAQTDYKRAADLYAHHAIAQRDVQAAESTRNQAQADMEASAAVLRTLGIRDPDGLAGRTVSSDIPLLAPLAGEVVERQVGPGQLLQAGATQCFTISNMSTVWVLANVYQQDLASVHVGDPVAIESDSYPQVFHGRISYIAAALDPATRTVQARIVTSNPGEKLKKDMYVTAVVQAGTLSGVLTVPDAAVLRDAQNLPFVYIQTGANQFARRSVTVADSEGGRTQITGGLHTGDHVVADGSLFLQFANSLR